MAGGGLGRECCAGDVPCDMSISGRRRVLAYDWGIEGTEERGEGTAVSAGLAQALSLGGDSLIAILAVYVCVCVGEQASKEQDQKKRRAAVGMLCSGRRRALRAGVDSERWWGPPCEHQQQLRPKLSCQGRGTVAAGSAATRQRASSARPPSATQQTAPRALPRAARRLPSAAHHRPPASSAARLLQSSAPAATMPREQSLPPRRPLRPS